MPIMILPLPPSLADAPAGLLGMMARSAAGTLLHPASTASIPSFLVALAVAAAAVAALRTNRTRDLKVKVLARALFPRRLLASASARTDAAFFAFNLLGLSAIFAWAVMSMHVISKGVLGWLIEGLGPVAPSVWPPLAVSLVMMLVLFLAYELAYWLDHYLMHKIPFLWEFHKVHHTAEILTPLTNFRMHPVDSILFANMLALVMGTTEGVAHYLLGTSVAQVTLFGSNALIVLGTYLLAHLHHTHLWIPFTGVLGRIFISPAHHQVHHSLDPAHFDKNMGSVLAVFDWMFGTLHVPSREREVHGVGVDDPRDHAHAPHRHDFFAVIVLPVIRAGARLVGRREAAAPASLAGERGRA